MNSHDIAEQARVLSHQHYAKIVEGNRCLLDAAREVLAHGINDHGGTEGHRMWVKLLDESWPEICRQMLSDSPEGRLLRSNSPFSQLIGISDTTERLKLWQQAKSALLAQMTSTGSHAA